MAATTLYLNDQTWRRADGHHATVRVYVGPLRSYSQSGADFVNGEAVIRDDELAAKLLGLGIARRTPSAEARIMARDLPARTVFNGPQTVANGRDARGRFTAGAPPGPGRPAHANVFAKYQGELHGALLAEVSPADVRAILRQVIRIAQRGHLPAVELLLKWVLGATPAPVDPDRLDEHELSVRRGRPTLLDELALAETPTARDPDAQTAPQHP
jgi:hypothetical protein